MTDYPELIRILAACGVEFIIVGGLAAAAHGSSRFTDDIDIVYNREAHNVTRLVECLAPISPYLRGAPPGLPFKWETDTVSKGLNFTLTTTLGSLDLFGEITLGGRYKDLLPYAANMELFGHQCLCLGIKRLIEVKKAAGRPKDFEAIAELELILQERSRQERRAGADGRN